MDHLLLNITLWIYPIWSRAGVNFVKLTGSSSHELIKQHGIQAAIVIP